MANRGMTSETLETDDAEMMEMQRDLKIRQREEEKEREKERRKRKEDEEIRRRKEAEEKALQAKLDASRKLLSAKQREREQQELLNKKRDHEIEKTRREWLERTTKEIFANKKAHEKYEAEIEANLEEAKENRLTKMEEIREEKARKEKADYDRQQKRQEIWRRKDEARHAATELRIDKLKLEVAQEADTWKAAPPPVPLKQALAGRLRFVPTVSSLFAQLRDRREELADLEAADLEKRAPYLNERLFEHVNRISKENEEMRLKVPEPREMDSRSRGLMPNSFATKSPQRK